MGLFGRGKRRQYIIDPEFQFRYAVTWLIITVAFVAVIMVGLWWGLRMMGTSETYGLKEIGFMLKVDAVFIVLITVAVGIYLLLLSHRVAGPAFRLEKSIQRMVTGDYDFSVTLREKDHLKRVASDLNNLLGVLRENKGALNAVLEDTRSLNNILTQPGISPEAKELIGKVEEGLLKVVSQKAESSQQ